MKRRLILTAFVAVATLVALPRCSSCWDDPDDPNIWVKKLKGAETKEQRETALFNLYRIYEIRKALVEKDPKHKKDLLAFRKLVNPVLVQVFDQKLGDKYVLAAKILERLIMFQADSDAAANLMVRIIKDYTDGSADKYSDQEDDQETLVAKAVDGLSSMAERGKVRPDGLRAIKAMIDKICVKRGSGKGVVGLDPRSFVRNAVVKSMPDFIKGKADKGLLARILAKVVHFGQNEKAGQDPMVTIFAIRLMGDVGDTSDESVEALVLSLLGKGRGRRFFSFAATAVAKLPLGANGKHPVVEPLILMLKGDPWMARIIEMKAKLADLRKKTIPPRRRIKDLEAQLEQLERPYKVKKVMPKCPYPAKYHYICRKLFWRANVEDWAKTEPGVIPMNALMVLREIGDLSAVDVMLDRYGIDVVRKRWLKQALSRQGYEDKKDKDLPGVQMQKMLIESYGGDMNIRSVMLRSLGRMNAAKVNKRAREELKRSLTWSGDPTMLVKAGEGIYLAEYDDGLMRALMNQITRAASVMMVNFKKRQVKMFFWGKVVRGTCAAGADMDKKFKDCISDPPKLPGQKEVKDANWNCFWKLRKYWLAEFYYAIKYFKPTDYKKLVQPFCQKDDRWWTKRMPALRSKAGSGDKQAKLDLYACQENPSPKDLKKGKTVKCGQWNVCGPENNFLCLDGQWQLRMHFYRHAALLTTEQYADQLAAMSSKEIMTPVRIRKKDLPQKEGKHASAFFDSDDAMYLKTYPWPKEVEALRRQKAKTILEQQMCYYRDFLYTVKRCGSDVNCYAAVVKGVESMKLQTEACKELKAPYARSPKKATPNWRHRLKALRMLAYLGAKAGPGSAVARKAIQAAISYYESAGRLRKREMRETREMILLVLDRVGDYGKQKDVMCPYPYKGRERDILADRYGIPRYEQLLARAKKYKRAKEIKKYSKLIKDYSKKVDVELEKVTKDRPCFSVLKLVIDDETDRRVKGVWQINRDARNAIGRLARRAKRRYDEI